ncbi:hypothetical protein FACS1894158_16310 [Betaproteobacteria bacterium]|nr:hypothetical protein FACS1894158_16310 [Betaproteobacteria bacterium]
MNDSASFVLSKNDGGFFDPTLPERKQLSHDIPPWVEEGVIHFITINCATRAYNQLAHPVIADEIEKSVLYYQNASKWWIHCLLLMPDHLHGLITFSQDVNMQRVVSDWKRYIARKTGIKWQRDFFDHRIRVQESLDEKWHYIRNNPVRKNLVQSSDDWPYQWHYGMARNASPTSSPQ